MKRMGKVVGRTVPVATAILMGAALTGCGSTSTSSQNGTASTASKSSVTLSVGGWPDKTAPNYQLMNTWQSEFQKKYPNITIKPSSLTWFVSGGVPFYTAAAAGQLPNLNNVPFTEPQKMISSGYAIPITSELQTAGWDQYLNPQFAAMVTSNGQIYGIPTNAYVMGMWYNVDLMKKAGLVDKNGVPIFPKTYQQLAQDAVQIKQKTGTIGFYFPTTDNQGGWEFLNIAWAFGAHFEVQQNGKWTAAFNSPQAVAALQYLKDLRWKYNVVEPDVLHSINTGFQLFGTNQVAMMFGTPDWFSEPIQKYHMSRNNYAMSVLPTGPAGMWAQTGGAFDMFAPGTTTAQINAGLKWLQFTGTSPMNNAQTLDAFKQNLLNNVKQGFPVGPQDPYVWTASAPIVQAEQQLVSQNTNVNMALFNDYMKNASKFVRPEPPVDTQQMYNVLDGVVQAVLTKQNANPQQLLDQAAHDFQVNYLDHQG